MTVATVAAELDISAPTARNALTLLEGLGIVVEVTAKQRDKVYVYRNYLDILEQGAEPTSHLRGQSD